jgi:hypothetical protein
LSDYYNSFGPLRSFDGDPMLTLENLTCDFGVLEWEKLGKNEIGSADTSEILSKSLVSPPVRFFSLDGVIEKSKEFSNNKKLIADLEKEYKDYTDLIKEYLQSTSAILTQLGLGDIYEGLSLEYVMDEEGKVEQEGLFLRNLPFNRRQQSYGEMVKILIMLSKAFNPDGFNYVKIGDFNLLDEKNQNEVLAIAEANDIQLGIEKVDSSKEIVLQLIEK